MDCSQRGSSIHGILQARILEWVAISFSRKSSQPSNQTWVSCIAGRFFTDWAMGEAFELWGNVQTLCLVSHFDNIQGVPPAHNLHLVTYVQSTGWPLSQILHLGSHVHSLGWYLPRNYIKGHMSAVSRVIQLPNNVPVILCPQYPGWLWTGVTCLQSRVWPQSCTPYVWSHTSTISKVTLSQTMHIQSLELALSPDPTLWVKRPHYPCWPHFPDAVPGITRPQSPGWSCPQDPVPGVTHPQCPWWPPPRPCT